jgi:hypothetical protein
VRSRRSQVVKNSGAKNLLRRRVDETRALVAIDFARAFF